MNLLKAFEETLDQLIANHDVLTRIAQDDAFSLERKSLRKLQQSLKAHIVSLSELYTQEKHSYLREQLLLKKYKEHLPTLGVRLPFSHIRLRKSRRKKCSL